MPPPVSAVATNSQPSEGDAEWQRGREQRVRALEAALDAASKRKQQQQQQQSPAHDYSAMLGGSSDDDCDEGEARTRGDGLESDAASVSSSVLYSEGQPLLCTYQPPGQPGGPGTAPAAILSSAYGSLGTAVPAKTADAYLPWSVWLRDRLRGL
ncbi:hypothetical protein EV174_003686, partial [Coemansia sp. RSA 2320]